ncbi:MAG: hypothetical protein ABI840_06185 [bacterium]
MKSPIIIFIILTLVCFSFFADLSSLSAKEINYKGKTQNYSSETKLISGHLTFVRVFKGGIWWIYVYDGSELVDVYPE